MIIFCISMNILVSKETQFLMKSQIRQLLRVLRTDIISEEEGII